ncbi:hypothetical protein FQN60_015208, partial [Etheostoma spectabile]
MMDAAGSFITDTGNNLLLKLSFLETGSSPPIPSRCLQALLRRELEAEKEGCASLNNESIDPPADDGSGCYDDRCSVTQSVEKRLVSQSHTLKA